MTFNEELFYFDLDENRLYKKLTREPFAGLKFSDVKEKMHFHVFLMSGVKPLAEKYSDLTDPYDLSSGVLISGNQLKDGRYRYDVSAKTTMPVQETHEKLGVETRFAYMGTPLNSGVPYKR